MNIYTYSLPKKIGYSLESYLKKTNFIVKYIPEEQRLKIKTNLDPIVIDKKIKRLVFAENILCL